MKYFHFNFCFNKNMLELVFNHSKTHTHIRFNSPVSRFNRVGRSPFNLLRHSTRSRASSRLRPISFMSLFTTSIRIFFGLPLGFGPFTSKMVQPFTQSQSSFLSTCPNHLSLFCFTTTLITSTSTPILPLNITLVILSLRDTPHIILIILISALSSFASCSALIGHVSLPYIIQLRTQLL